MNKKENNNHKFNIKDLKFINKRLIITVLLLIITVTSGTLAWFTYRSDKSALVLKVGDIDDVRVILKPYHITGSLAPSNIPGMGKFTQVEAINDSNYDVSMNLYYKINHLSDTLINKGLRYTVMFDELGIDFYEEIDAGNFTNIVDDKLEVLNVNIPANTTLRYKIYVWVLELGIDQSDIQGEILDIELTGTVEYETVEINEKRYTCNEDNTISVYNISTCIGSMCNYTKLDNSAEKDIVKVDSLDLLHSEFTGTGVASNCGNEYVKRIVDDDYNLVQITCIDEATCNLDPGKLIAIMEDNVFYLVKTANLFYDDNVLCEIADNMDERFLDEYTYDVMSNKTITSVNITGDNIVGSVLTANGTDMNSENTYSYQWYTNGTNSTTGGVAISGATSETLTLTEDYIGKYVYVVLTSVTPELGTITFTDITDEKIITNITTIN